jgi:hypothetical protein
MEVTIAGKLTPLLAEQATPVGGRQGEQAVQLLKAASRYQRNPLRKQRVWVAVSRGGGRPSAPVWRFAFAMGIVLCLLGGTAIASAALGHWPGWVVRAYERLVPRPAVALPSAAAPNPILARGHWLARRAVAVNEPPNPGVDPPAEPVGHPLAATASAPPTASTTLPIRQDRTVRRRGSPPSTSAQDSSERIQVPRELTHAPVSEDERPVLVAMRALRRDNNPVLARSLLQAYLAEHPTGALAEEALALSIESAVAHHDSDAEVLAARYLQKYPTGPFGSLARQTLTLRQKP